jgi:hypothetical protein
MQNRLLQLQKNALSTPDPSASTSHSTPGPSASHSTPGQSLSGLTRKRSLDDDNGLSSKRQRVAHSGQVRTVCCCLSEAGVCGQVNLM